MNTLKIETLPVGSSRLARCLFVIAAGLGVSRFALSTALADGDVVTAVSSQVSSDYVRKRLPDGSIEPETYTFGKGGHLAGTMRDDSVDKLDFMDLAKTIAVPLASRQYVPATDKDPNATHLLIMVYWGKTSGAEDASDSAVYENLQSSQTSAPPPPPPPPTGNSHVAAGSGIAATVMNTARQDTTTGAFASVAAENALRDQADLRNARLLGYDAELAAASGLEMTAFRNRRDDLIAEIEENRYFIVLMAYDFQALWKHKQHKLLWVARMSVRERGTNFTRVLPSMVQYASQFFGEDSHGLLRRTLPQGHVEVGELRNLGDVPQK